MAPAAPRLNTSQSEGSLSVNSRLSASRREKLINLKQREDLKDALTQRFKHRFGHGAAERGCDEVSVASTTIRREVNNFAQFADVTEANLNRLERRLHSKAQLKASADDVSVAGVSAYSGVSQRSLSVASLAGRHVVGSQSTAPETFDWSRLDEYASYLHEQDALRQKLGVQALQRKMRMDLDQQVDEKKKRRQEADEEERRYFQNSMVELERWKQQEQARADERHQKVMREKQDRDEQLNFERMLKAQEAERKKQEESSLVEKIVTEMEVEQRRFEKKKAQTRKAMRRVFEENAEDQKKRAEQKKELMEREAEAMREYNRVMDEQEEQRAQELQARLARQSELMRKLQANVDGLKKGAGDNDAQRASAQQEEQDRHFFEAEAVKQARLKQMRLENQAYLLKQMEEKDMRKMEDRELTNIQAQILERDTQEYNEMERQKTMERRVRNFEHRKDIEKQMEFKLKQTVPEMSEAEIAINKPLLSLVQRTLQARDQQPHSPQAVEED